MKNRIEKLLFHDESRLPLLTLLPEVGAVEDLSKLRVALSARLERVELQLGEISAGAQRARIADENDSRERSEREMLRIALNWISLQEGEG